MNIVLGKIGQKIIFNRKSKECDRSNTNGNVGTSLLFRLLIENNKDDTFYIVSENDLGSFKKKPFENVVDASDAGWEVLEILGMDAMFILTGLMQYEKNDKFIDVVNNIDAKFILLSDDPRCLDSVSNDDKIKRKPDVIISQFDGIYNFKGVDYKVKYEPIERASCYKCKINNDDKDTEMVIISNTSGKEYDRVKIIYEIINGLSGFDIYGRLSEEDRMMLGIDKCKGEVKYTEMQNILRKSFSTFLVPIKKGWVTSKYVESLMNGVLPIFYKDYNTSLLETNCSIVVNNKEELVDVLENVVKKDKEKVKMLVEKMTKDLIEPYIDGTKLSDTLMSYINNEERKVKMGIVENAHIRVKNADEAFLHWYKIISDMNINQESRDGEVIGEIINATTVIEDPTRCFMNNKIRKMPFRYAIGELLWYLSGNNSIKEIQKYTSAWDRMSDDGKTVNSNYGYCIQHKYGFDQWKYILDMLSKNPNSRQAVIHIKEASNKSSKDVNCTVCCQFFIRDNKLYMTTYMRSNDIWMGFPYDVFQFTAMQILLSMQLGVELGTYTHIAGSLHMYKRDYIIAKENEEKMKAGE